VPSGAQKPALPKRLQKTHETGLLGQPLRQSVVVVLPHAYVMPEDESVPASLLEESLPVSGALEESFPASAWDESAPPSDASESM
jgi:hypothetical protein